MPEIIRLQDVSDETITQINKLIHQLVGEPRDISKEYLEEILSHSDVFIFIAKIDNTIAGMFSLFRYCLVSGKKVSLEDVVVDESARGQKVGEAMVRFAIDYSINELGISKIDLTSSPNRLAANALYQKLGFKQRTTNVYRWESDEK